MKDDSLRHFRELTKMVLLGLNFECDGIGWKFSILLIAERVAILSGEGEDEGTDPDFQNDFVIVDDPPTDDLDGA